MPAVAHHALPFAAYLRLERDSEIKHEFINGEAVAMAGGTIEHARIGGRILRMLGNRLDGGPCDVLTSDMRIRIQATGRATYPDGSVVCGEPAFDPEDPERTTITNPRVIVEVLSPSTEKYDRGEKLEHYQQIPSVCEVLLVAYDRHEIEIVRRDPDGTWSRHVFGEGESATIASIQCKLLVDEIYRQPRYGG